MPDLGKYAVEVYSAYAATIVLIVAFVLLTLAQGRRVRAEMRAEEDARKGQADG